MTSDGRADCTHDRRCYALILLATFASPRRGEATALRRCDLDLDAHVRVRPAYAERSTGEMPPVLYLPRPTGVAPHSPWYTLAADTNLGDLQEDILAAMREGALITVSASLGGSDGTLVLNGAELPFAVLAGAELTTQPG